MVTASTRGPPAGCAASANVDGGLRTLGRVNRTERNGVRDTHMTTPSEVDERRLPPPRVEPDWAWGHIAIARGEALPSFEPIEDLIDA